MFAVQSLPIFSAHVAAHLDRNGQRAAVAECVVQVSVDVLSTRSAAHHHHAQRQDDHGQCQRSVRAHVLHHLRQNEDGDLQEHGHVQQAARAGAVSDGRPLQGLHLDLPGAQEVDDREHAREEKHAARHPDRQIVALSEGHPRHGDRHRGHRDREQSVQRPLRDLDVERDWACTRLRGVCAPSAPLCAVHHVPREHPVSCWVCAAAVIVSQGNKHTPESTNPTCRPLSSLSPTRHAPTPRNI